MTKVKRYKWVVDALDNRTQKMIRFTTTAKYTKEEMAEEFPEWKVIQRKIVTTYTRRK